jgi:flagellar biosynthetic protein FliR
VLQQFLTLNIFAFLMVFTRIETAFIVLPGFSAAFISVRARLFFALAVSFVVTTTLSGTMPGLPNTPTELFLVLAGEAVVGGFLETLARILMSALQTAGTIFSFVSSMANAFVQDPIVDQQSSLVAGFLGNVGILMIFATNSHYLMIEALVDSYTLFVPGQVLAFGDFAELIGRRVADSFRLGVQLASPFIIVGLNLLHRPRSPGSSDAGVAGVFRRLAGAGDDPDHGPDAGPIGHHDGLLVELPGRHACLLGV